jgi:hypothetical protein
MRNLGYTIDKILKVVPSLEGQLLPIKSKWEKYPSRTSKYWKELGDTLNTIKDHPRWSEIKNIVLAKRKPVKKLCSFELPARNEKVIGIIPENMADRIRRHDRATIEVSKKRLEASMTRDMGLMAVVMRKDNAMEIDMKKIWLELKDHFKLWDKPASYGIRKQDPFLILVSIPDNPFQMMPGSNAQHGIMRMDPDMLKKFLDMMGMEPPMFPPPEGDQP